MRTLFSFDVKEVVPIRRSTRKIYLHDGISQEQKERVVDA